MLVAFALVLTMNRLTVMMSIAGVFLAASYPYLKRYTYLPQVFPGMAFGWGILMAFAAIRGEVPPEAWLLYIANILWSTAVRHRVRDGRPRRRPAHGREVDRDPVRRHGLIAQGVLYALFDTRCSWSAGAPNSA